MRAFKALAAVAAVLAAVVATIALPAGQATPVPPETSIHTIQGATHVSPLAGQTVQTTGIVTALRSNGFYIQDPAPDADPATSEGIFVFTSTSPTVGAGDSVSVTGAVSEFRPTSISGPNLTLTEITSPTITVLSSGNALPGSTVLGAAGVVPPSLVIEDDVFGSVETSGTFDPSNDGIDYYEALEGMRVEINDPVVVGATTPLGEFWVLADSGANSSVRTTRGGVVISATDFNPERIQVDGLTNSVVIPLVNVGDTFAGPLSGIMDYSFGNYEVLVSSVGAATDNNLVREVAAQPSAAQVSIASFNVENLDPTDPAAKFARLANIVVANLRSPDILTVEEIQDNSGPTNNGVVDASTTFQTLISAIVSAGGPTYSYRQIDPVENQDGGEPGGNIRVGFLFRTDRGVSFVDRAGGTSTATTTVVNVSGEPQLSFSPGRVDPMNAAFTSSRKPLAGEFLVNGTRLFVIANHFNSKGGDQPLFGRFQPPSLTSEVQRNLQAQIVNDFVDSILAVDANSRVVVLGDINDFQFSNPMTILKGDVLHPLVDSLPAAEQYTYVFDGNSQAIDHILVSDEPFDSGFAYDIIHVNSEFADQASDHDPPLVLLTMPVATQLTIGGNTYWVSTGGNVNVLLQATLTASSTACTVGSRTVEFFVDANGDGSYAPGESVGTATTGPGGVASLTRSLAPGIYAVKAVFEAVGNCLGSEDESTLSVVTANDAANGGGWYQLSGVTGSAKRVNFAFTTRWDTKANTYRGQLLIINKDKWRLKGDVTSYVKGTTNPVSGIASGTAALYRWDTTTATWIVADSSVTFRVAFTDTAKAKKTSPDMFTVTWVRDVDASVGAISPLVQTSQQPLKGGNIYIK